MKSIAPKIRFAAKLQRPKVTTKASNWSFVVVPRDASAKLSSRGLISVEGTLDGFPFQATLEPDGQGGHWLRVDQTLREEAGAKVGASVTIAFSPVTQEPEPKVPIDLQKALSSAPPRAASTWSDITPVARRDWIHWITSGKRAETRAKRIGVAISKLTAGDRRPCCFDRSGIYSKGFSCPVADDAEEQ